MLPACPPHTHPSLQAGNMSLRNQSSHSGKVLLWVSLACFPKLLSPHPRSPAQEHSYPRPPRATLALGAPGQGLKMWLLFSTCKRSLWGRISGRGRKELGKVRVLNIKMPVMFARDKAKQIHWALHHFLVDGSKNSPCHHLCCAASSERKRKMQRR